MSGKKTQPTSRPKGRPPKGAPPALPAEEVDRLLVFGEVVTCDDGESQTVVFPSYRDLAERFEVSTTLIAKYSKEHNCLRRRKQAKARIQAQADQKLVELRATAVALSKDDELRIIDGFLAGFEKALAEGRVRFDNPGDFNTMVRLKEFVMGGADSRQEIHASLSLEDIQARHQRMLRVNRAADAAVRGELPDHGEVIDVETEEPAHPPRAPSDDAAGDLNVHLGEPAPTSSSAGELQEVVRGHESVAASDSPVRAPVGSEEDPASHARTGAKARDAGASGDLARPGDASARVLPRAGEGTVLGTEPGASSSPAGEMNSDERVHLEDEQQHQGEEEHGAGDHGSDDDEGANGRIL